MENKEPVHKEETSMEADTKPVAEPSVETKTESQKDKFLPLSILIAAVVIAGSIIFATVYHPSVQQAAANNPAGAAGTTAVGTTTSETAAQINTLGPRDAILGSPNAPVTLIEYGDYQCPFCARYFQTLEPQIKQLYIDTGKVKMVFRNFPFLGAESTAAAEAAECAEDQNQLWAYHDALYQAKLGDDAKGGGEDDGFFTPALFIQLAQNLHMDIPTFTSCISNNKDSNLVTQDYQNASVAGVNSTPSSFINGTMVVETDGTSAGADNSLILQELATATAKS